MKTIRSAKVGRAEVRLVQTGKGFAGVANVDGQRRAFVEGDTADDVWCRIHDEAAKLDPSFFGFDGAAARFLRAMPGGFASDLYVRQERAYKLDAKTKLDAALPLDAATGWSGDGEGALKAFRGTNLLSPFESTRVQNVLRSPAAVPFIRGAARFASGDVEGGLRDLAPVLKPFDAAKWTVITYLPFLWRPEAHMFLKPEVTREFATRVGHRFADAYTPELRPAVYDALLDLVSATEAALADLRPVDRIDVQSFIFVVGRYTEDDIAELARRNAEGVKGAQTA